MYKCNLCKSNDLKKLIDFGKHPVAKHYYDKANNIEKKWPVKLYFCNTCGLTQLQESCPPELLYDNYVTLSSWKPQVHLMHEVNTLLNLPGIHTSSTVIEVGCNDGNFLEGLREAGLSNLLGVEPALDAFNISKQKGFNVINEFLTLDVIDKINEKNGSFDLFVSRQNLEHIKDLETFRLAINKLLRIGGYVLIEVPNFACNLKTTDYSLWEEHVNYFTYDTLQFFLMRAGVEVIHWEIIKFSGEGLIVIGRRTDTPTQGENYLNKLTILNNNYASQWEDFKKSINNYLRTQVDHGKKIALYGAGSRVICLINFLGLSDAIDVIVDDQEEKQNKYMLGWNIPIMPSNALYDQKIDICLLGVNGENEDKVIKKHEKWLNSGGLFWSVLPPSPRLLPIWNLMGLDCGM